MEWVAPLGQCNAGVLTVWTLFKLSRVEPIRIFLWSSPSYLQLLSSLIVSLEGESRNAGASLGEQNIEDVWGHARCWERHPAKTISHRQWVFRGRWNVDKLKRSGRQTIHVSYCSRRHLLPSVYPSFNKPMSHATYFWGQVISHFTFVPRWVGLDTGAAGGEGLGFGVRSTGWFLFYDFLLWGIVEMFSMSILPPWQQHFQKHPDHIPVIGSGCRARRLGLSNWIISPYC